MHKIKILYLGFFAALVLFSTSCQKELEVGNPNSPTLVGNVTEENGLAKLAQGGIYLNGLSYGDGWLGDSYFSLPRGYHELMGDIIGGGEGSNNQITTLPAPDYIQLDATNKLTNPSPNPAIIRAYNSRAATAQGNNALMYEWMNMYAMQQSCNNIIALADKVTYTGDKATKIATVKAWAYFWKGWAYAQIGTLYIAGIVTDTAGKTSNTYVTHDAIISRSNYYYDLAVTTLGGATVTSDYTAMLGNLIPASSQVGNGQLMTKDMWVRNINTLKARNILLNKMSTFVNGVAGVTISKNAFSGVMTAADWNAILTLTANGGIIFDPGNNYPVTSLGSDSSPYRNRVSNGNMVLSQRAVDNITTHPSTSAGASEKHYAADRFAALCYYASASNVINYRRTTGTTLQTPEGHTSYIRITNATNTALGSTDYAGIQTSIEGYDFYDSFFGGVYGVPFVLSFWVRSTVAGNYCVAFRNGTAARAYVTHYNIASANTWQKVYIPVPPCGDGTWSNKIGRAHV